ncbi:hypothetical protein [Tardiphaga sp.]|jgi:hypothetical protein|uniref:hypothetical protein n=1 Tax=Tardiphaga sp. TaxID=1926292 RepID=UPI0037D9EEAC
MTPYLQRQEERSRVYRAERFAALAERVRAGETLKDVIDSGGWTFTGFGRFEREYPQAATEIRAISKANSDRKKKIAAARKVAAKTHCVRGHELSGDNVFIRTYRNGDRGRVCRTCARLAARVVRPMTADQVAKVTQLVHRGVSMKRIFHGGSLYVTGHQNMQHQRMIDPAFDKMMAEYSSRGHERAMRTRAVAQQRHRENEYRAIRAMVPRWLTPEAGDDVAQSVIVALIERSIRRDQIAERVRLLVAEHNRGQKFGANRILSLDVSPFDDGAAMVERVATGLWS